MNQRTGAEAATTAGGVARAIAYGIASLCLLAVAGVPWTARAESGPPPFVVPIARDPIPLGSGYDGRLRSARGDRGACVEAEAETTREPAGPLYAIETLSRVGGRLVIGVYVAAPVAVEVLENARLTDAARRLERAGADQFHAICGDGFIASRTLGGQWMAEIEVERPDVARAGASLVTGTWSDPEAFGDLLAGLVERYQLRVRELPEGSRAKARPLAPEALVERATGFPATLTRENAQPILASYEPYPSDAFAGMLLPDASTPDVYDIAKRVFRGEAVPMSDRAARAADLRAAQVRRSEPEPAPAAVPPPAPPAAAASGAAPAVQAAATPAVIASPPVLRRQAALVFVAEGEPPVYATTRAPAGVFRERAGERSYWVPGAAEGSPEVVRAIARARDAAPVRGTTVVIAEGSGPSVVMTDVAPIAGIHSEPAGERRAWIAGVAEPDAAERAALAAALRADAGGE